MLETHEKELRRPAPPKPPELRAVRLGPAPQSGPPFELGAADGPIATAGNVVLFRRKGTIASGRAAAVEVALDERPAPNLPALATRAIFAASLLMSVSVHAAFYAWLNRPVPALASIGLEAMSVELVLGADTPAGRAQQPSEQESQPSVASRPSGSPSGTEPVTPSEAEKEADPSRVPAAEPPPEPTAKPAVSEEPAAVTAAVEPSPEPPAPQPASPPVAAPTVVPPPPKRSEPRAKPAVVHHPAPEKPRRERVRTTRGDEGANRQASLSAPSMGSNGVGRGRSTLESNYPGLVAAHLARFKRFPVSAQAHGDNGTAIVRFTIDGGGRVSGVGLASASGNSTLDRESVEVVRRASPFPAPPDGRPHSFTQPIRFNLH